MALLVLEDSRAAVHVEKPLPPRVKCVLAQRQHPRASEMSMHGSLARGALVSLSKSPSVIELTRKFEEGVPHSTRESLFRRESPSFDFRRGSPSFALLLTVS